MRFEVSCPSKTFIMGEYLVLNDGPALLVNTAPRFRLIIDTEKNGAINGISPDSPTGQWLRQNRVYFENVDLEFSDPHMGLGGFGASSAQYLLTQVATYILKNLSRTLIDGQFDLSQFNIEQVWRTYRRSETVSEEGLRPSGADIVSQAIGGLCDFRSEPFHAGSYNWPFDDYEFFLAHTGTKLPTHEHLRGLKKVDVSELAEIYSRAMKTLAVKNPNAFFESMNDYYAELLEIGLVAETTQVAVASLIAQPFVAAVKGCGAMGHDVIVVCALPEYKQNIMKLFAQLGLKYISGSADLDVGFHVSMNLAQNNTISDTSSLT